ncbi:right-handed parallel beta-helix repeat-containing protein [Paenibacillus albus]|uniref:DUF1565 domain-containing protein n=1 Tax=Paenibacillus albus TaxID=2495582 RepID=A0A3Q8X3X1_9BACL|nr:right-handed parallel beta-helix repeat-containing protein [Paenibacillus albus]AZN39570.1 DUF1565 domain-containing protein [Paenibacillus albus]
MIGRRRQNNKAPHLPFYALLTILIVSLLMNLGFTTKAYADARSFYVAATGNDSNPGTLDAPWRTIQKAANSVLPGDTVFVRGGVYSEFVSVKASGNSTGYITFQNYANETPILDGSGLTVSNVNQALWSLSNTNYVRINGFEIRNLTTSSSSFDPVGILIFNGGSNIQIANNNIHDIKNTATSGNAHGILALGNTSTPLTGLEIRNNQIHNLVTGWSESLTLSGNIDGFSITNNKVYDNNNIGIELAGYYNACSNCVDQVRNGTVAENTVYGISTSTNPAYGLNSHSAGGIYVDGGTNISIERNHVFNNDFGVSLASEKLGKATTNITLQNNFIHHNYRAGLIMGGGSSSNGGAAQNLIYNNTFVENDSLKEGFGEITLQNNNTNNMIANNIIYSNSQKISINKINKTGSGNKLNFNLFYNPNGAAATQWKWDGVVYTSWSAYKTATGNDADSAFSDPLFMDKASLDIRLKSGSSGIDKGSQLYVTSSLYDFNRLARVQGQTIDIGATEYVPPVSEKPTETVDTIDWSKVPALSTGTANAKQLKAIKDKLNLNIAIDGASLDGKSQIYIDVDNNKSTGFAAPFWANSGAEYLLEGGTLYRYAEKAGTNWSWTKVQDYRDKNNYSVSSTNLVVAIPFADMGVTKDAVIKIGYVLNDSVKLPASGSLLSVNEVSDSIPTPTPEPTPTPTPTPGPAINISIDGNAADWDTVASGGTGTLLAKTLKLYSNDSSLFLLVQGDQLTAKSQFFINSDNRSETGYQVKNSSTAGSDYLIENGVLYRYSGTGTNWAWSKITAYSGTPNYLAKLTVIEARIPLTDLGLVSGNTIRVTFIRNDNNSDQISTLLSISTATATPTPTPEPAPTPTPAPAPTISISIDGNADDWNGISKAGTGTLMAKTLKLYNKDSSLYLLVQGEQLTAKGQFYISADNRSDTGYQVKNSSVAGADYLIENGTLYRYSGTGLDWTWSKVTDYIGTSNYVATETVIEARIQLSDLGIVTGSTICITFMRSDNASDQTLSDGKAPTYVLQ